MAEQQFKIRVIFPSGKTFDRTLFRTCLLEAAEAAICNSYQDHLQFRDALDERPEEWGQMSDAEKCDYALAKGYRFGGYYTNKATAQQFKNASATGDDFILAEETDFGYDILPEYQEEYREKGARLLTKNGFLKKYLVSGHDPFMGHFGGIRSVIIHAESEDDARMKARERFGENFGKGMDSEEPYGIHVQETDLDVPPELPEHWK